MLANFHPPNRPGSDQRFNANLVVHLSEARIVPCPRPSGHARSHGLADRSEGHCCIWPEGAVGR